MKRFIFALLAFLWLGVSASAADIVVQSADNLQTKIDSASCSDTVTLDAGSTWDGTFTLPNKGCTVSTPITLRSSAHASLPAGRSGGSADAANMPRLRTLGSGLPTLRTVDNAGWWIIDGIEITDNNAGTSIIGWLVDFSTGVTGVHDMVIQRCYFHQKETGTNYFRTAERGINWNGDRLTVRWNYFYLIGYPANVAPSMSQPLNTTVVTVGGSTAGNSNLLIEDNYISVWYSAFFFGGQDTSAAHTATLSPGATTTQATFSSTTSLIPGAIILLSVNVRGTLGEFTGSLGSRTTTLTRVSGAVLTNADVGTQTWLGTAMKVVGGSPNLNVDLRSTSGDVYTVGESTSWDLPGGTTYDWELLTTVMVDTVNTGTGVVTYHPYGTNRLAQNPSTPGKAQWSAGDEGLVNDVTVRKNTFYIDPAFAEHAKVNAGQGPKGYFEIKNCNRMIVEGNRFGGWPTLVGWTGSNQNGGSPWTTTTDVTFRNNWFDPLINATTSPETRPAIIYTVNQYRTARPGANFQVYNNVFKGASGLISYGHVDNQSFTHNTFINNSYNDYNAIIAEEEADSTGFVFSDNIVPYTGYGLKCGVSPFTIAACWNPNTILNNVVIDDWPRGSGTVYDDVWGTDSTEGAIAASFAAIGFTNLAGDILSLAVTSPYKGLGTGGSDPGVDWAALQAALTGANNPPTTGAGLDQNLGPVTSTTLMGTASDPDGDTPLTYSWVRTSGPNTPTIVTSTALTTLVTGMTTGTYVFTLTVTDPDGASSSDTVSVIIAGSGAVTTCRWPTSPVCQP